MADEVDPDPPPPPPEEVVVTTPTPEPVGPIPEVPPDAPPPQQGCFSKRTCLEKFFIVLIVIIVIICLAFVGLFIVWYLFSKPPVETCLSQDCVTAGSKLRSYMDDSHNPCDNFYQYACGGWVGKQSLDADEQEINSITRITDANRVHIKSILTGKEQKNDTDIKKKPRAFYKACMNTEMLERLGSGPFEKLTEEFGSIPTLDQGWNESEFDLMKSLSKLVKLSVQPLFTTSFQRELEDPKETRIFIGDADLPFHKSTYEKHAQGEAPEVDHYKTWMSVTLQLLGADANTTEKDVTDVLELQAQVAGLMRFDIVKKDEDKMDNEMQIDDLNIKCSWLRTWDDFLNSLVPLPEPLATTHSVIVTEEEFLTKLGNLIKVTKKRTLANYITYPLLKFTEFLTPEFEKLYDDMNKAVHNKEPTKQRWERCAQETEKVFPDFMSRMYIDMYFNKKAKPYMESIVADLRFAFKELVDDNAWMHPQTREKVKQKIEQIKADVAYPDYILDDKKIIAKYETISAGKTEYMQTIIDREVFNVHKAAKEYGEDNINTEEWKVIHPITVKAVYRAFENQIVFPAALIQDPLFDLGYSYSMNYGSIGSIIGHEFTHALDTEGRKYNADGEEEKWWPTDDIKTYEAQSECLVEQYGCFKWDNKHSIDGKKTLADNIADNGGLRQAFKAYRNFIRRKGLEEQRLPGVADLTHDQLFFLSFGQAYCSQVKDEYKAELVKQPHTPKEFRVYGAIKNSKDFAEAFKCRPNSRMNPINKCEVW